jgi:hypothetical protein
MPFCSSCGNRVDETAKFCSRCGNRLPIAETAAPASQTPWSLQDMTIVWQRLFQQMEMTREKWWELMKENVSDAVGTGALVNPDFQRHRSVPMREDQTPPTYPYNTVDGENVEGLIMVWQLQNATGFAMNKKNYLDQKRFEEMTVASVKMADQDPRLVTMMAGMFGERPIEDACVATVVAHYLMSDPAKSQRVTAAYQQVIASMPFLRALTFLGTATAFGDAETAQEIMRMMRS